MNDALAALAEPIDDLGRISHELAPPSARIDVARDGAERGLAQLVLTIVELLRQLMERQAIRRMEAGTVSDEQVEAMGDTFMKLEQRMAELREHFGLEAEDLNLDLGPLGRLL
ncbi:MAG TPA: gas vesicle protein K [Actinomycetota bacterium]|nr:gas vesicle protein K [Actinomycetota bacterium]